MGTERNKILVALGALVAGGLLLAAFTVVWLLPHGPATSNASVQTSTNVADGSTYSSGQIGGPVASGKTTSDYVLGQTPGTGSTATTDQPHISVRGTGNVSAKPDMANLQVGVQIQQTSLDAAQSEAATKSDAITKQLTAAGIADTDISTSQYSVEPVMNYNDNNQPPTVTGFRVTNILNVKIRDISKAGKLIDDLVKSGANTIYGLSFGFSDPSAVMQQAREQAMGDAKTKATQLAGLGGVTLGQPLIIEDSGSNTPPPPVPMSVDQATKSAAAPSTAISPGQQQVTVDVSVVYAIK